MDKPSRFDREKWGFESLRDLFGHVAQLDSADGFYP